jgi:hypothetical protein
LDLELGLDVLIVLEILLDDVEMLRNDLADACLWSRVRFLLAAIFASLIVTG